MNKETLELTKIILDALNEESQGLDFDEPTHTYSFEGEPFYSVTTIMNQLAPYKFKDIPQDVLMNKAKIGTYTHQYGELIFNEKRLIPVDVYLDQIDPLKLWGSTYRLEIRGYLEAMFNYWQKAGVKDKLFASEIKLIDKNKHIAGIADLLRVDFIIGSGYRFSIPDYKTSATIDVASQGLQQYKYAQLANEILGDEIFQDGCLIQLKKDGTYKEYWFKLAEFKDRWDALENNWDLNIKPLLTKNK